ncbi:hypothetical protein [Phaeovulum sp.]|uniref:hypothetical protein n=1 Tax=Phaeovulum sp. TaxID=2934796 RepID=UPI0027320E9F|nr:hypothetical protein [Phaeovulum sp.]MDP1668122.1 hypothetical protein [Phaeovulum sp.]MDZ4120377.1 hypothetical protein [Phaeovulum sp.]
MSDAAIGLISALLGALIGSFAAYWFALRQDKVARRRERVVSHLIAAYRALEQYALLEPKRSDFVERQRAFENALGDIFLLGDERAIELVREIDARVKQGQGLDVKELALHLRGGLRKELGLVEVSDRTVIHFRGASR